MGQRTLSPAIRRALSNTGWLGVNYILGAIISGIVTFAVARYLGAQRMGRLQFALSLGGLLVPLALFASNEVLTRALVRRSKQAYVILGTGYVIRLAASALAFILTILIALVWPTPWGAVANVAIAAAALLPWSLRVIEFWFNSRVESRYVVIATLASVALTSVARLLVILLGGGVQWFLWAFLGGAVALAVIELVLYQRTGPRVRQWRFHRKEAKAIISDSWPFMMIGLAVMTYMRVDQVMIGQILDSKAVGIYAAAAVLAEMMGFIPLAVSQSVLPAIIELRHANPSLYRRRLQQLYDIMTWSGVLGAIALTFLARPVIHLTFGPDYVQGANALSVLGWAAALAFQASIQTIWVIAENRQRLYAISAVTAAAVNVALNSMLIPRVGIIGAAWATLTSFAVVVWLPTIFRPMRTNQALILWSWTAPWRALRGLTQRR